MSRVQKRSGSRRASGPAARASGPSWLRQAVAGHEEDVAGVALVLVALVSALGVYGNLAGPLGEGLSAVLGAFFGLARFVAPLAILVIGIALVRDRRSEHRPRLVVGTVLVVVAVTGLLHIAKGPDAVPGTYGDVHDAGGWIGSITGQPLQALVAPVGGVLVLLALGLVGAIVLTQVSLRTVVGSAATSARRGVKPGLGRVRKSLSNMSTLASERLGHNDTKAIDTTAALELPPGDAPFLYDSATDPDLKAPRRRSGKGTPLPPPDPAMVIGPDGQATLDLGPAGRPSPWRLPPANLLERSGAQQVNKVEIEERGRVLERSLASHGVETRLVGMTVGPTVTRYELELGPGVKVARVTSLHRDIAYAMAAVDVRILAPIPGRSAIGVEVPNQTRHKVSLGDILAGAEAKTATHPLEVAIGKDIAGRGVMMNLATTPHLLIAGATGAGKSSGINCILTSILMRSTPDQVRLILVDPKQVEMGQYQRLPHLLTQPVTDPKKAANALAWAVREMERRYDVLAEVGYRDVTGYNAAYDRGDLKPEPGSDSTYERLPYIVVVVDELNDLMMVAARDVEESITRIAQKARAVGIHLIVATQRPSVNVITGVIKANVPARMAFAVSSLTDSRVILDQPGAERLVGAGDMLLLPGSTNVPQRIQGAWVSEEEVRKVVAHWRRQTGPEEPASVVDLDGGSGLSTDWAAGDLTAPPPGDDEDDDALVRQAMDLIVRSQLGSTSMLQRKLRIGFARAGRIMDLLEQRGVVGPSEGSKARAVLMTPEELDGLHRGEHEGRGGF